MKAKTFEDVLIKPKYSEIESREHVDLSTQLGTYTFTFPIISANMRTITGEVMAKTISHFGGLGLLHRFFNSIEENVTEYNYAVQAKEITQPNYKNIGVSIGVKEDGKRLFEALYNVGARIFCVDVAHGHHLHVKNMLRWINNEVFLWDRSERAKLLLIAGNVATAEGVHDLAEWGADAVKVGLGPGRVCTTRMNTGCGIPQLYALQQAHEENMRLQNPIKIVADGGCSCVGDIAKALKYADAVMIGSMIAGTDETPGEKFKDDKKFQYKVYGGSASKETKGHDMFIEGVTIKVPAVGPVKPIFYEIKDGLRSAFSYVGAKNLTEYHNNCEFIDITSSGRVESKFE